MTLLYIFDVKLIIIINIDIIVRPYICSLHLISFTLSRNSFREVDQIALRYSINPEIITVVLPLTLTQK